MYWSEEVGDIVPWFVMNPWALLVLQFSTKVGRINLRNVEYDII